jgi:hypothetical protein
LTLARHAGVPAARIGTVGGDRLTMQVEGNHAAGGYTVDVDLATLHEQWARAIPRALGQD